jgi:hypothetical protein
METRTYELQRLSTDDALALLTPYIRDGGRLSARGKLVNVTEKPDRLELIEKVLKQYDGLGEAVDVALDVQVIEADGYESADSSIADIEGTLRQMFKYRGYKLVGSTHIRTREAEDFTQVTPSFRIMGNTQRVRVVGGERRIPITIKLHTDKGDMESTVTATLGKPIVVGQSTNSGGATILVIRPSLAQQ